MVMRKFGRVIGILWFTFGSGSGIWANQIQIQEKKQTQIQEKNQTQIQEKNQVQIQEKDQTQIQEKNQTQIQERSQAQIQEKKQTKIQAEIHSEFNHPEILSFEGAVAPAEGSRGAKLSLSDKHYKHGEKALCYAWRKSGTYLSIRQPIAYEHKKTVNSDNSVYTFIFWMYLEQPLQGSVQPLKDYNCSPQGSVQPLQDSVRFEFRKAGKVCCWFNYGADFTGWRGAWVAFLRDMQGTPEEGMDELRIYPPAGSKHGTMYLDHIILSSLQDIRHHTADMQAPYINPRTENHWLVLLRSWRQDYDLPLPETVSNREKRDVRTIQKRMDKHLLPARSKAEPLSALRERYAVYQLDKGQGLPIFFERYGEAYEHWDKTTSYTAKIGERGLSRANQLLYDLAVAYRYADGAERDTLGGMFLRLTRHLLDQGFQAGSAMGTLHHLGYSMRLFYPAMYLMREPLGEAGLLGEVQQAMEWFSGAGEIKQAPTVIGMDIDAFNTSLEGRLMSVLLMGDGKAQVRALGAFSRWVDNGYRYSNGLSGSFKPDGTIFHHCNHYPAYAVGGLTGAVDALYFLHGTSWAISEESHAILKKSLLAMRTYCNLLTWPLSLSGRHPDGKGHLIPSQFGLLSVCGSPDGTEAVDKELAGAYLRLTRDRNDSTSRLPVRQYRKEYEQAGLTEPEKSPTGSWSYPYSCLQVQRRGDWMVAIKGHSRYIWNTETYEKCNLYGRYLNYGNVQILGSGRPISNFGSGYRQEGFDWAHIPGTTATVRPIDSLRARIENADVNAGFEEMLQSDEAFCNGLSFEGQSAWGMKLHSHDKYDGTLRARKSVFCFENRVICLGTNICSDYPAPTETTLFQVATTENKAAETAALTDGFGNYYYPFSDSLYVRSGLQHSRHEETDAPTEGYFTLAALSHGVAPKNAHYEYVAVVQPESVPTEQEVKASYRVVQADSAAHIVQDTSGVVAYVLFEPQAAFENSLPCLLFTQKTAQGMTLRASDPDLHLYEGASDESYDENGKRKERIIYSYKWKDDPSRMSRLRLTLPGQWKIARSAADFPTDSTYTVPTAEVTGQTTLLTIPCQHGMGTTVELLPL